jgi:Family of unknown function (DUF6090)
MIKFFRRIRQNLLTENKFSKYLLYAIGEIILVVIGILIALSINNWNEAQKSKLIETALLQDFKKGLEFDILQMDSISAQYDRATISLKTVLKHLEENLPYTKEIDTHFFNTTLLYDSGGLTVSAYETLKSGGLNLISSKEILDQIISVYDEHNPWMLAWEKKYANLLFYAQKNIYNSRFEDFWGGNYRDPNIIGTMKPLNYEALKYDNEYKYLLKTQINLIGWLIFKPVKTTKIELKKLLSLIDQELDSDSYK